MRLIDALYKSYLPLGQLNQMAVLDAAGGLGQMSDWFLHKGSQVHYFDVSDEMVKSVRAEFSQFLSDGRFTISRASITEPIGEKVYDVVNAHAVLEWLEDPFAALSHLIDQVAPGGYLCLMVYNRHMLMLRHMMRGTLSRAMAGKIAGDGRGLTPISPLDPAEVVDVLTANGFDVKCQAGIRSFSDLAEKTVIEWYDEDEVFNTELAVCRQRPYCDLGRYVLLIAQNKADGEC